MLDARLETLVDYPFQRLNELLSKVEVRGNMEPLSMAVGEPQLQPPALLTETLARHATSWNRYPPVAGTPDFLEACAEWLKRRFWLPKDFDPVKQISPVAGTREGLYMAAFLAISPEKNGEKPTALMANPLYQVYYGAAIMAGAEPVLLRATRETGDLPDLDAIPEDVLRRCQIFYLCSPANPQGSVADLAYLKKALLLARQYDFLLVADECYSEIYTGDTAPMGSLQAAEALGGSLDNLIVFHTLSKRSNAAGLRSGFAAGSVATITRFNRLRNYSCASTPLPAMAAAAALWRDEAHVDETRALYRAKYDLAEKLLGDRFKNLRPAGGFYLWLDVGDGEKAAQRLWSEVRLRSLPGAYITRPLPDGTNEGQPYLRLALVHDLATTEEALSRLNRVL